MKSQSLKLVFAFVMLLTSFCGFAKETYKFQENYNLEASQKVLEAVAKEKRSTLEQFLTTQYSTRELVDFLSFVGVHSYSALPKEDMELFKFVGHVILKSGIFERVDLEYSFMDQSINEVSPLVKHIVMSPQYEDYLFDLYLSVTGKAAPSFWTNYDLFNNIVAWNRKNQKLFVTEIVPLKGGKNAVRQVPSPELQILADYLSKDVQEILKVFGVTDYPEITFVNMKQNRASAWYSDRRYTIYINLGSPNISWPALMGEVLWHELFHVWQNAYTEQLITDDMGTNMAYLLEGDYKTKENMWIAGVFNANLKSYQLSSRSYDNYRNQPIEAEAFEFGKKIFRNILK